MGGEKWRIGGEGRGENEKDTEHIHCPSITIDTTPNTLIWTGKMRCENEGKRTVGKGKGGGGVNDEKERGEI